ncbi:hypothetical protein PB01_08210 [Psychrobacillus glaciei]|uniref:GNAT family N-acetyltransferase n=1 Tax=Psychrobacillus glaciei TaxID=2283160 RepID=A0A5J6SRM0_9BACI|nr:hypothetical protein [Psychrobacillus glaciei]QFF98817.1 hypothetical protein PB01_08210 [Psychrobacillus glaciei]
MFGFGIYKKRDVELYRELYESDEIMIHKLRKDIMNLEESRDLVDYIKAIKDDSIVGIVQNKDRELFALTKREDYNNLTITMKNSYRNEYPYVNVTLYKNVKVDELGVIWTANQELFVEGIFAKNKRKGNGRILINAVISYAKANQYNSIAGRIIDEDKNATPGLPDFYEEMGFTLNEEGSYFKMKL